MSNITGGSLLIVYGVPHCARHPHDDARGISAFRNAAPRLLAAVAALPALLDEVERLRRFSDALTWIEYNADDGIQLVALALTLAKGGA